jgi:hypothetical protein
VIAFFLFLSFGTFFWYFVGLFFYLCKAPFGIDNNNDNNNSIIIGKNVSFYLPINGEGCVDCKM